MTAVYRALPDELVPYASAAIKYFAAQYGVKSPRIEDQIRPTIAYRPTLQFTDSEQALVCVEIVDQKIPDSMSQVVLSMRNEGLPIKLWVGLPAGRNARIDTSMLKFCKENGLGLLELTHPNIGNEITHALSQSICGLRPFDLTQYPAHRRQALKSAIETFRTSNPSKGVSEVYDEIEHLTRAIGRKASSKAGFLRRVATFDWETESWQNVAEFLEKNFDRAAAGCDALKANLFVKVATLPSQRNQSAHKPVNVAKRIDRDRRLRTRFEEAMDTLHDLAKAARPLRV